MSKKQIKKIKRIIIALVLFIAIFITNKVIDLSSIIKGNFGYVIPLVLYLSIYLYIGYDVLYKAIRNILNGKFLDENFLMCFATLGAFIIGEFPEGVAVLLFYQIGEFFEDYAVSKSRKSIATLMDIRPDFANVLKNDEFVIVDPSEVEVGDTILVKPGEKIPLDGYIIKGVSTLDTKALTGESLPQEVEEESKVISGTINLTGNIEVKVEKAFYDSTVSKILDLVENAASEKSKSENFITKFAKYYTPIVVALAVLLAVIPGIITKEWLQWVTRSLNFLVVSCPCALVISIPLSFFSGLGGASKQGILVKGSAYLETFDKANIFVFDKTGTLTKGNFAVVEIMPEAKREEILHLAATAENYSLHPIALSIKNAYNKEIDNDYEIENVSGKGIIARGKDTILLGNEKLMKEHNINYEATSTVGTTVYVAKNNEYVGLIVVADEIKENAKETIQYLNSEGSRTIMLTGDNDVIASSVAKELGLTEYKSSLLPQNKVEEIDRILHTKNEKDVLCFVGDGINDAPVLMKSDIGIAMGGVGSDAAIEASDIVLMHDDLSAIILAKKIAKKTLKIVKQNIWFAIGVKIIILILSAVGLANMWLAVFGDVGVSVIAILNSMRAVKYKK